MTAQLSRERLEEIAALPLKKTPWGLEHAPGAYSTVRSHEIVEMARMLLAGMEKLRIAESDRDKNGWYVHECARLEREMKLSAPPAQVAVPDEITQANAPELREIAAEVERLGLRGAYGSYAVGWNACRAAILKPGHVTAKCPKCGDTRLADSGGVQPWGEPISIPCDCTITLAPEQE